MDTLFITHLLNALLMIAMPVGLAIFLTHKFKLGWGLWWIGAAIFVLSQVGHIPFNALIAPLFNRPAVVALQPITQTWIQAIFLGLSAGLFEELFRYAMFRWWARDARSWRKAILTGAGHGGAEAILLGALALYGFIQLAALRHADLSKLFPPTQLSLAQSQVQGYWSTPWPASLLGALERFLTIPIQISMAVLVVQTFIRKQWFWVGLAILYHAVIDTTAVAATAYVKGAWLEVFVAFFAVISVLIIFGLRRPEPPEPAQPETLLQKPVLNLQPVEESEKKLQDTRFE